MCEIGKPCRCSDWMLQSSAGQKWRIVWKRQHFIAIHYWGYISGCHCALQFLLWQPNSTSEDVALETAPSRPRLWKRYVDDIICILRKDTAEELLNHLDGIQPTIKFTVELEDGTIPFLDTLARRREHGGLDITVYRNHTHTDRYLHFQSHHPAHVKRGLVKCFHNRARGIISSQNNLQKELDHLARVLRQNGYPTNFICSPFAPPPPPQVLDTSSPERDQEKENRPPVMIIPYDVGMSENIRHACRKFYIRVVFKSGQSLHRKDTLP